MTYLIIGTPDSGKSEKAESLTMELAGEGKKYYIATMIPYGEEGAQRVKRHLERRNGKGFETKEKPVRVQELIDTVSDISKATCLLECMSNLIGNEMHEENNSGMTDEELTDYIIEDVMRLAGEVINLVIVTNSFEDDESYDDDTRRYVRLVSMVNESLKNSVDRVYELSEGKWQLSENH